MSGPDAQPNPAFDQDEGTGDSALESAHSRHYRGPLSISQGGTIQVSQLQAFITGLRRDESGQGLAEYALILVLIAILSIFALTVIGGQISGELSRIGTSV